MGDICSKKGGLYGLFFFALTSQSLPATLLKSALSVRDFRYGAVPSGLRVSSLRSFFFRNRRGNASVESENSRYGCFRQRQKAWKVRRIVRSPFVSEPQDRMPEGYRVLFFRRKEWHKVNFTVKSGSGMEFVK